MINLHQLKQRNFQNDIDFLLCPESLSRGHSIDAINIHLLLCIILSS